MPKMMMMTIKLLTKTRFYLLKNLRKKLRMSKMMLKKKKRLLIKETVKKKTLSRRFSREIKTMKKSRKVKKRARLPRTRGLRISASLSSATKRSILISTNASFRTGIYARLRPMMLGSTAVGSPQKATCTTAQARNRSTCMTRGTPTTGRSNQKFRLRTSDGQ